MNTISNTVSLSDLFCFLKSDYKTMISFLERKSKINKIVSIKKNCDVTTFHFSSANNELEKLQFCLNNFIFCLTYKDLNINNDEDECDELIKKTVLLKNDDFIELKKHMIENLDNCVNKKKIINTINTGCVNNALILFVCQLFDLNIFVNYVENDMIKLYYYDESFCPEKNCIFLQYEKDIYSQNYVFQLVKFSNYDFGSYVKNASVVLNYIETNKDCIYPVGLLPNKIFQINLNVDKKINSKIKYDVTDPKKYVSINTILFKKDEIDDLETYNQIVNGKFLSLS